jgi:hypothetical protein
MTATTGYPLILLAVGLVVIGFNIAFYRRREFKWYIHGTISLLFIGTVFYILWSTYIDMSMQHRTYYSK